MLLKNHHPNGNFFVADIFDNASFKDDMASMAHPIFTLSKKRDMRNLEYRRENISVNIVPSNYGLPTIFDKDILLYCGSLLMAEVNAGRTPPRTLRVSCHDLLVATNRMRNGLGYERLRAALDRLRSVSIKTNIKTGKREQTHAFGLIESYRIIESSRVKDRMVRLEITLSEWFYHSIIGKEVLTINKEYFRLKKPMERRLYEIARKHCGNQEIWQIGLIPLMEKVGSTGTLRKFRYNMHQIAAANHLPDYTIHLDDDDTVTFSNTSASDNVQGVLALEVLPTINQQTLAKAKEIVALSGTGWDFNTLHEQFTCSLIDGFTPENVNGAFINFIKKKTQQAA